MQLQNELRYKDESFYIGNGTFVTSDICIPLNAISTIKVQGKKTINLNLVLSMIAIGVLLLLIPSLRIAGCFIFACGLVTLGCLFLLRYLDKYGLVIQVNSGVSYLFEHEDLEFIRKIADIIRKGLDDSMKNTTFVDMSNSMIKPNFNGNPSFQNFGENNQFDNTMITGSTGEARKDSHDTISNTTVNAFSEEEWNKMETYFHKRAADLGEGNQAYLPCKKMELCARKKDLQGLWKLMKGIGKTTLVTVLEKMSESGVEAIFRKLISMMPK